MFNLAIELPQSSSETSSTLERARVCKAAAAPGLQPRTENAQSPIYEATVTTATSARAPFRLSSEIEAELMEIFDAPGFGAAAAIFFLKERALMAVFASLTLAESRELLRRLNASTLSNPVAAADQLRVRFHTFVVERRTRLLAFLADAPRRAAIARR
jgi:hypothetical protein